jgi:hypothetical protein
VVRSNKKVAKENQEGPPPFSHHPSGMGNNGTKHQMTGFNGVNFEICYY